MNIEAPFFTIIVPCCDVEPYVRECLDSVVNQPFTDWECILGVEESKDNTEEIAHEYVSRDSRFKMFTRPRSGSCSASRNTGIDMAQGEYIIFLDGDDTIADGCLERIYKKIMTHPGADLYPCVIIANNEINGKSEQRDNYGADAPSEMTGPEAVLYLDHRLHGIFCPMLQLTVHRREFLVKNNLKCICGLRHQDSEFSPRALYLAKRVVPLHEPYYLYRIRPNSVQTKAKGMDYFMKDWSIITKSLLAFYDKVSREDGFDAHVVPCWIRQWFSWTRMNYQWFSPIAQKQIPREKRVEWLCFIFEDGFDSYERMMRYGSCSQRLASFHVQMFVKHPSLRWFAELFFRVYFSIADWNRAETTEQLCSPIPR